MTLSFYPIIDGQAIFDLDLKLRLSHDEQGSVLEPNQSRNTVVPGGPTVL